MRPTLHAGYLVDSDVARLAAAAIMMSKPA